MGRAPADRGACLANKRFTGHVFQRPHPTRSGDDAQRGKTNVTVTPDFP